MYRRLHGSYPETAFEEIIEAYRRGSGRCHAVTGNSTLPNILELQLRRLFESERGGATQRRRVDSVLGVRYAS
jgi:hypothetical protein